MRQITYICLFLLVFLSACAPRWIKPGMTEQQLAQDTIECRQKASAIAGDYPTSEAPPSEKKDIISTNLFFMLYFDYEPKFIWCNRSYSWTYRR